MLTGPSEGHTEQKEEASPPEVASLPHPSSAEFQEFLAWKNARSAPSTASNAPETKKQKCDADLFAFIDELLPLGLELMDMDPQLRHQLETSQQARDGFRALHMRSSNSKAFDTETGAFVDLDISRKRPFEDAPTVDIPNSLDTTAERSIKEVMSDYHSGTFLPSLNTLLEACQQFYSFASSEFAGSQLRLDMQDSRLKSLEASRDNRTVLLRGLPATGFNRAILDRHMKMFLEAASLSWSDVSAMHNHIVSSDSSILRVEFVTEISRVSGLGVLGFWGLGVSGFRGFGVLGF